MCENCHSWRMRGQVVRTLSSQPLSLPSFHFQEFANGILCSVSLARNRRTLLHLKHSADDGQSPGARWRLLFSIFFSPKPRQHRLLDGVAATLWADQTLDLGSNHGTSVLPDTENQSEGPVSSWGATCVTSRTLTALVLSL